MGTNVYYVLSFTNSFFNTITKCLLWAEHRLGMRNTSLWKLQPRNRVLASEGTVHSSLSPLYVLRPRASEIDGRERQ